MHVSDDWDLSVVSATVYNWGILLRVSQVVVPKGVASRVFVITLWLYAIILTTGYSSNLTAFLTVSRAPPSMNSFRELQASSRHVLGLGPFFQQSMASSGNSYLQVSWNTVNKYCGILKLFHFKVR